MQPAMSMLKSSALTPFILMSPEPAMCIDSFSELMSRSVMKLPDPFIDTSASVGEVTCTFMT